MIIDKGYGERIFKEEPGHDRSVYPTINPISTTSVSVQVKIGLVSVRRLKDQVTTRDIISTF